jgi:hypothetical protein
VWPENFPECGVALQECLKVRENIFRDVGSRRSNGFYVLVRESFSRLPQGIDLDGYAKGFEEQDFGADETLGNAGIALEDHPEPLIPAGHP